MSNLITENRRTTPAANLRKDLLALEKSIQTKQQLVFKHVKQHKVIGQQNFANNFIMECDVGTLFNVMSFGRPFQCSDIVIITYMCICILTITAAFFITYERVKQKYNISKYHKQLI